MGVGYGCGLTIRYPCATQHPQSWVRYLWEFNCLVKGIFICNEETSYYTITMSAKRASRPTEKALAMARQVSRKHKATRVDTDTSMAKKRKGGNNQTLNTMAHSDAGDNNQTETSTDPEDSTSLRGDVEPDEGVDEGQTDSQAMGTLDESPEAELGRYLF